MGFKPRTIRRYNCDRCRFAALDVETSEQSYADTIARKNGWSRNKEYGWVCRRCRDVLRIQRGRKEV